jgi:hypothetical protein
MTRFVARRLPKYASRFVLYLFNCRHDKRRSFCNSKAELTAVTLYFSSYPVDSSTNPATPSSLSRLFHRLVPRPIHIHNTLLARFHRHRVTLLNINFNINIILIDSQPHPPPAPLTLLLRSHRVLPELSTAPLPWFFTFTSH